MEALAQRVDELGRRVRDIEQELRAHRPEVLATRIEDLEDDVRGVRGDLAAFRAEFIGEVKGLRKAVLGFALTVAGSAVAFALTVVLVWGS
jgi:hypothetical protein